MRDEILQRIEDIEREHNVIIHYAVESGSRAWGFASVDSDYDVRFIYSHAPSWYLSVDLEQKRDVIEYPIVDELDINGWELRKALKLLWRSNPALVEWLQSPVVYWDNGLFSHHARQLVADLYQTDKGIYHYRSMAKSNYREYLQQEEVPLKKYFYVLRPLLAIQWLKHYQEPAPVEFDRLRSVLGANHPVNKAIEELLILKRSNGETKTIQAIPALHEFIESQLFTLEAFRGGQPTTAASFDSINHLFRTILNHTAENNERGTTLCQ